MYVFRYNILSHIPNIYEIPTTINERNRKKKANTCYQQLACIYIHICIQTVNQKNLQHTFYFHPFI